MSDAIFPSLPGLTFDVKRVPTWSTTVQKSRNRARTALMNDPYPLWTFELTYEFLRAPGFGNRQPAVTSDNPNGYSDLELLEGFYNSRNGSFDDFLLDLGMLTQQPGECTVSGIQIGVGDGVTQTFQLVRDCGGFLDEVQDTLGDAVISVDGNPLSTGFTQGTMGDINFAAAPASGAIITAAFDWRMRMCFAEDSLGTEGFLYQLYELQSLKLEQVKR